MRSRLQLFLTALLAAALTTAGCQPVAQTPAGTSQPQLGLPEAQDSPAADHDRYASVEPTGQTVVFWHPYSSPQQETLLDLIDTFNRENSFSITVEAHSLGSYQDVFSRVLEAANTPAVPDLLAAYQNHAADLYQQDVLVDLSALVNSPDWGLSEAERADYPAAVFEQDVFAVFSGARLGFPVSRSAEMLYVNRDWLAELGFSEPPETPEQFQAMACAANESPFSRAVLTGAVGYELDPDASRMASWAFAFGADLFDEETNTFTLNGEPVVESMRFLQGLIQSGCASLASGRYSDREAFGSGTLLFSGGSSAGMAAIGQAVSDAADFVWETTTLPGTAGQPVTNLYGASLSISRSSPDRELAAWLFIRFLSQPEIQAEWAAATGTIPVRASAANLLEEVSDSNSKYRSLVQSGVVSRTEPSVPGYDAVRQEMEKAMTAIMIGADVQSTLDVLNQTANEILAEQFSADR